MSRDAATISRHARTWAGLTRSWSRGPCAGRARAVPRGRSVVRPGAGRAERAREPRNADADRARRRAAIGRGNGPETSVARGRIPRRSTRAPTSRSCSRSCSAPRAAPPPSRRPSARTLHRSGSVRSRRLSHLAGRDLSGLRRGSGRQQGARPRAALHVSDGGRLPAAGPSPGTIKLTRR